MRLWFAIHCQVCGRYSVFNAYPAESEQLKIDNGFCIYIYIVVRMGDENLVIHSTSKGLTVLQMIYTQVKDFCIG